MKYLVRVEILLKPRRHAYRTVYIQGLQYIPLDLKSGSNYPQVISDSSPSRTKTPQATLLLPKFSPMTRQPIYAWNAINIHQNSAVTSQCRARDTGDVINRSSIYSDERATYLRAKKRLRYP